MSTEALSRTRRPIGGRAAHEPDPGLVAGRVEVAVARERRREADARDGSRRSRPRRSGRGPAGSAGRRRPRWSSPPGGARWSAGPTSHPTRRDQAEPTFVAREQLVQPAGVRVDHEDVAVGAALDLRRWPGSGSRRGPTRRRSRRSPSSAASRRPTRLKGMP